MKNENNFLNENNILVEITNNKLNIMECIEFCKHSSSGALSIFIGTTRDTFEDKKVSFLEYEYHPTMAIKELFKICKSAKDEFKLNTILAIHRVGKVEIMEESILIISSSSHRLEANKSTAWVLEEIKKIVPIWKKEYYIEDKEKWKEN